MSTILEAQRELDRQRSGQAVPSRLPPTDEAAGPRWPLLAVAVALGAVSLTVVVLLRRTPAVPPAPNPVSASARAVDPGSRGARAVDPAGASAPARREPVPEARADVRPHVAPPPDATPWGRVEKKSAATRALAEPPLADRGADMPPERRADRAADMARDRRADVASAPRRPPVAAAWPPAQADGSAEPGVRLKSVYFSKVASERTVTLEIGGGRELTLRQGERAAGVEVQLILPTMAYVHQGAAVFAISLDR